jgi:hypothetical protein
VGFFSFRTDLMNSFQVILVDRSDITAGDFDVEFNYNRIRWETGEASQSGGVDGLGGYPARVGITDGQGQSIEFASSGKTLELLDEHPITHTPHANSLIHNSRGTIVNGRYILQIRNGGLVDPLSVEAGANQNLNSGTTVISLSGSATDPTDPTPDLIYRWDLVDDGNVLAANGRVATILNPNSPTTNVQITAGSPTFPSGTYIFRLRVSRQSDPNIVYSDAVTITIN